MQIDIKKLVPELENDFIEFFDNYAFSDGSQFSGCYCVWYHWNNELENELNECTEEEKKHFNRNLSKKFIRQGVLQGYLAYANEKVIGWCNVNDRKNYDRLNRDLGQDSRDDLSKDEKCKSIVCFIVIPEMRGKGIATELLKVVCKDTQKSGYSYIEAYPATGEFKALNYHGPYSMYEKQGFKLIRNENGEAVVRRYLV